MVSEDGLGGLGKKEEGVSRHQSFSEKILDLLTLPDSTPSFGAAF